ncbi:MAG: hypothetical protein H0Z28_08415 [Archaeoglobus sp.]|nr:hypothetical protein [Archaeoglobus sp.]
MREADTKLAIVALLCLIGLAAIPKAMAFSLDPISQFAPIWLYVIYRFTGIWKENPAYRSYFMIGLTVAILLFYTFMK